MAPYGDVDWVRNLRAAGRATITVRRHSEQVTAVELTHTEAVAFYRDALAPSVQQTWIGAWIVRHLDKVDVTRPEEAADGRPVFEIYPT
jgi:hypothetical protein